MSRDVKDLLPLVQLLNKRHTERCKAKKLTLVTYFTKRTFAEQEALYMKGRKYLNGKLIVVNEKEIVTNAPAGYSWHNWGVAYDASIKLSNGDLDWYVDDNLEEWNTVVAEAECVGLTCGAKFKSAKVKGDWVHFEWANLFTSKDFPALVKNQIVLSNNSLIPTAEVYNQPKMFQVGLNVLGFDCGYPDGVFGPKTNKAREAFKTKYNLEANGTNIVSAIRTACQNITLGVA